MYIYLDYFIVNIFGFNHNKKHTFNYALWAEVIFKIEITFYKLHTYTNMLFRNANFLLDTKVKDVAIFLNSIT